MIALSATRDTLIRSVGRSCFAGEMVNRYIRYLGKVHYHVSNTVHERSMAKMIDQQIACVPRIVP